MKNLLDAFDKGLEIIERGEVDIECCGQQMVEFSSPFTNEAGECEPVGYECEICGIRIDLNGREIV